MWKNVIGGEGGEWNIHKLQWIAAIVVNSV